MKATELMIGNYVKYTTPPYIQVASLTRKKIGYHREKFENRLYYVRLSEVTPIPLTDELLKKNGIEYQFGMPWYQGGADGEFQFRYMSDDIKNEVKITIRYVHELQNVLALCGVKKHFEL